MIKDGYVVKKATENLDSNGKIYSINISFYREGNEKFIYSHTYSIEDFKKLYGDLNVKGLNGQRIKIKEELILK